LLRSLATLFSHLQPPKEGGEGLGTTGKERGRGEEGGEEEEEKEQGCGLGQGTGGEGG